MADGGGIVVRSEDDAWKYLELAVAGEFDDADDVDISFEGWPCLTIKVQMPDSTITPTLMAGFVDLQQAVYRGHAEIRYGRSDLRALSDEDRAALEFSVKVESGSSIFGVNGEQVVEALIDAMKENMTPAHWVIIALGVSVVWFGQTAWNDYLDHRTNVRLAEIQSKEKRELLEGMRFLSNNETQRMKILAQAVQQRAELARAEEHTDDGRKSMLKSLPEEDNTTIGNSVIHGSQAQELTKSKRRRSVGVELRGMYAILRVDTTAPDGFRVRLQRADDGSLLTAGVQDVLLSKGQREAIQRAEWAKRPVWLRIDAKQRDSVFVDAVIKDVRDSPPQSDDG
tara:strand:+ start:2650 stop:3669 length:1020 start_codon:yes stop_codon:yes gene_type:complete